MRERERERGGGERERALENRLVGSRHGRISTIYHCCASEREINILIAVALLVCTCGVARSKEHTKLVRGRTTELL